MISFNTPEQKELVEKWIAALRSGKYKQGSGALHRFSDELHHYCCIGVLCEVAGFKSSELNRFGRHCYHIGEYIASTNINPKTFVELTGFYHSAQESLICLNDQKAYSFHQIADLIEAYINQPLRTKGISTLDELRES